MQYFAVVHQNHSEQGSAPPRLYRTEARALAARLRSEERVYLKDDEGHIVDHTVRPEVVPVEIALPGEPACDGHPHKTAEAEEKLARVVETLEEVLRIYGGRQVIPLGWVKRARAALAVAQGKRGEK